MPEDRQKLLAVLIDADNVPAGYAEAIFEEIASFGEASIRRIYGDFARDGLRGWSKKLANLAIVPMQAPSNTRGKNSSDIALVIDAMDILHTGRFDGFVLVSSDSDFTRLASRIREQGLTVIGIGEAKVPDALKNACNRFVAIENIWQGSEDAPRDAPVEKLDTKTVTAAQRLFFDAMEKIDQEDEWFPLGRLGQQIQADKPDFDTRSYGKKKLSDLVKELKVFETKIGPGNQLLVRRLD